MAIKMLTRPTLKVYAGPSLDSNGAAHKKQR